MNLHIDTANNKKTILRLDDREYVYEYKSPRDQDVLKAISDTIAAEHKDFTDLTSISVNSGPGSFTGLRVGISIANAMSFALDIPINDQKAGTTIVPNYGKPPSITIK